MAIGKLSWEQFNFKNPDRRMAFEDLCRLLFKRMFFDKEDVFHSNSNNPGVEVEPVYSKHTKSRISYQSKYFDHTVSYSQILHSAQKAIDYYKGKIDTIYLFCNLTINKNCNSFKEIVALLSNSEIDIVTIDNTAILDKVVEYPILALSYFNVNRFTLEWLKNKFRETSSIISERYNPEFNVITTTENNINLFAHTQSAVEIINSKKYTAIEDINDHSSLCKKYKDILEKIVLFIDKLPDISISNITDAVLWRDKLLTECHDEFEYISSTLRQKTEEAKALYESKQYKNIETIHNDIKALNYVLHIPNIIGLLVFIRCQGSHSRAVLRLRDIKCLVINFSLVLTSTRGCLIKFGN